MPEISRFYGIIIRMYYEDHNPPHFHAVYGDDEAWMHGSISTHWRSFLVACQHAL